MGSLSLALFQTGGGEKKKKSFFPSEALLQISHSQGVPVNSNHGVCSLAFWQSQFKTTKKILEQHSMNPVFRVAASLVLC